MRFDLERLGAEDVEALAALKLFEEVGVGIDAACRVLSTTDEAWMRTFLGSGPAAIGGEPFGLALLRRARLYRRRAQYAGRLTLERASEIAASDGARR